MAYVKADGCASERSCLLLDTTGPGLEAGADARQQSPSGDAHMVGAVAPPRSALSRQLEPGRLGEEEHGAAAFAQGDPPRCVEVAGEDEGLAGESGNGGDVATHNSQETARGVPASRGVPSCSAGTSEAAPADTSQPVYLEACGIAPEQQPDAVCFDVEPVAEREATSADMTAAQRGNNATGGGGTGIDQLAAGDKLEGSHAPGDMTGAAPSRKTRSSTCRPGWVSEGVRAPAPSRQRRSPSHLQMEWTRVPILDRSCQGKSNSAAAEAEPTTFPAHARGIWTQAE